MTSTDWVAASIGAVLALMLAGLSAAPDPLEPLATPRVETDAPTPAVRHAAWHGVKAAPAPAPRPATRESSQEARDLFALFQRGAQSLDWREREDAAVAFHQCSKVAADANLLRTAAAMAEDSRRRIAAGELLARCRGFETAPAAAVQHVAQGLQLALLQSGSRLADGIREERPTLTGSQVAWLLQVGDAAAFEQARPSLAAALARHLGVAEESDAMADLQSAVLLASCEFGRDCGAEAFDALRRCSYQGRCGGVFDGWDQDLPPPRAQHVLALRDQVAGAVRQHDFAALGIGR